MTHSEIIARWPAGTLARLLKVGQARVRQWKRRNSIPPAFWQAITKTDRAKRDGIRLDTLRESYPRRAWGAVLP
jgi:hypothetical protein